MSPADLNDTSRCPLGVRCDCSGAKTPDLAVVTRTLCPLGVACLTMCHSCASSGVVPPVAVATGVRLAEQHARHVRADR